MKFIRDGLFKREGISMHYNDVEELERFFMNNTVAENYVHSMNSFLLSKHKLQVVSYAFSSYVHNTVPFSTGTVG